MAFSQLDFLRNDGFIVSPPTVVFLMGIAGYKALFALSATWFAIALVFLKLAKKEKRNRAV